MKKILVIRSATRVLNPALQSLKKEFPGCRITVLGPGSARDNLSQDPLVDEVVTVDFSGRMTLFGLGREKIRFLRRQGFDLAVSLYNIDHGMGYSNVDLLLWISGAREMRGYNPSGKHTALTPWGIVKKNFLEKTSFLWIAVNAAATLVLFACITLGLLVEWCVRKLCQRQPVSGQTPEEAWKCLTPSPTPPAGKFGSPRE